MFALKVISIFSSLGLCEKGDVLLAQNGTPFLFWNGKWYPICGHWFWDNDHGATAFCTKLGYESGRVNVRNERMAGTYGVPAIHVGKCRAGEELTACTGTRNHYDSRNCNAGDNIRITITCNRQIETYSSCTSIKFKFVKYDVLVETIS